MVVECSVLLAVVTVILTTRQDMASQSTLLTSSIAGTVWRGGITTHVTVSPSPLTERLSLAPCHPGPSRGSHITVSCPALAPSSKPLCLLTVTPSLVSDGGFMGWPQEETEPSSAPPPQPLSSPNRLKRLTNTDSVYTMCQTPDGPKFQCAMCARIFNLKCTLLRHVRHQHQGRFVPHPCKTCGQVFKRTDHLKVHMKKIHNISVTSSSHHSQPVTLIAKPSPTVN